MTCSGRDKHVLRTHLQVLRAGSSRVVGDCLLAAAFLVYAGAFTQDFRDSLLEGAWLPEAQKLGLPVSSPCRCVPCSNFNLW